MRNPRTRVLSRTAVAVSAIGLALSACSAGGTGGGEQDDGRLDVLASFYPLQYVTEQVGGEHVTAASITPPGVDPHELELAPASVATFEDATLVYLSGFQPALDDALATVRPAHVLDVAAAAGVAGGGHAGESGGNHTADDGDPDDGDHAGHDHGADPHFWLDPTRLAAVTTAVGQELAEIDPANAGDYTANAERLVAELDELDARYTEGLATCESRTVVAGHEAYGFLADRYDLEQVALSGLDPDAEPSPARLAEIARVVEAEGVSTIFAESLVNPAVSETLADDLGIDVAQLDPLETQLDPAADYQDVMRANLDALREGLRCS